MIEDNNLKQIDLIENILRVTLPFSYRNLLKSKNSLSAFGLPILGLPLKPELNSF